MMVLMFIIFPLSGLDDLPPFHILLTATAAAPLAPMFALYLASIAQNKVQGFALLKGLGGTLAKYAAQGARVTLVERYNCLGGLSTGGLVMWIDRMTDWQGNHVIQGFAREFIDRLPPEAVAGPPRADWGSRDVDKFEYWRNHTTAFHGIVQ
jgi:hypothetical protein